jgi:hypothetical protein
VCDTISHAAGRKNKNATIHLKNYRLKPVSAADFRMFFDFSIQQAWHKAQFFDF